MESNLLGPHYRVKFMLHILILWGHAILSDAFDVTIPKTTLLGIHSQSIVLGCSFTATGNSSLEHIVITWQRTADNEVVHSYHYGKDQLAQQNKQYSGRTSLFPEEFKNGNVSLKLDGLRVEDAGLYMCFVSSVLGSAEATMSLAIAAYYKEPEVLVKLQSSSVTFILTSQGYPEASVFWHCAEDNSRLFKPEVSFAKTEDGLYSLESILDVVYTKTYCNFMVEIQNHLVNQTIIRKFNLLLPFSGEEEQKKITSMAIWIALGLLLLVFAAIIILYLVKQRKKHMQLRGEEDKLMVM
ncbi:CD276 antigen-like [Pristis pectinata]|uniref:CD276 antigen-like n=1 Tax=Pristis pectinata TaxID=685728 RepID=UPI00223DDE8E|nr:CD276 antigen-like [Pristis pectinata]